MITEAENTQAITEFLARLLRDAWVESCEREREENAESEGADMEKREDYGEMLGTWREEMDGGKDCIVAHDFRPGPGFKMGHYCIIEEGCTAGDDVTLGHFVLLKKGTLIGDRVFVDSYVKSSGDNRIGDDVVLRFNATIAREVTVEDGAFISPNVMTVYSTHERERKGGTVIGAGSHIGTNAVIGPGVKIAPGTVVGALAYVSKDIGPGTYVGIPAKRMR